MLNKKKVNKPRKGYDLARVFRIFKWMLSKNRAKFHAPRSNSKLGDINGFSLAPIITCTGEACRTCGKDGCYAVKNMLCHGYNVDNNPCLRAWMENTVLAKTDLPTLWECLERWFNKKRRTPLRFFRIHPSGDFFSVEYAKMWYDIASKHPEIKFLAFTKAWNVVREVPFYELENFSLVLSGWTGVTIPEDLKEYYRCAYCVEAGEEPPEGALECPGSCLECGMCWFLKTLGKDTYFHKH